MKSLFALPLFLALGTYAQSPITSAWSDWSEWKSSAAITCLGLRDSILWMSTKAGLARIPIQGGQATVYTRSNSGIPFDNLTTVDVSNGDEVLMGSPDGAIALDGGRWTSYTHQNAPLYAGRRNHPISGITRTKEGTLWLATKALVYTMNNLGNIVETDYNVYDSPFSHYLVKEGNQGAVFAFDGSNWATGFSGNLRFADGLETVLGIVSDPDGNTWSASREFRRGTGEAVSIQEGDSRSLPMDRRFSTDLSQFGPRPWIGGMHASDHGLWAAFYGKYHHSEAPTDVFRSILFIPKDSGKVSVPIVLSNQLNSQDDKNRFGGATTLFSLDTAGNPWVLVRDTLYGYEQDGTLFGTEIIPPELASQGPFKEMRIDKRGVIYLRNDSTVFWKIKPKPVPVNLGRPARSASTSAPVSGWGGIGWTLPWIRTSRPEYFDAIGRSQGQAE